jgi:hypothetical protein
MIDNLFAAAAVTAFSDPTRASNTTTSSARAPAFDVAADRAALLSWALAALPAWEDTSVRALATRAPNCAALV